MQSQTIATATLPLEQEALLMPLLVAGGGRTGTTLLMQLLGTDSRCIFDTTYPLEGNYLSHIMYFLELFHGRDMAGVFEQPGGFHQDLREFPTFQKGRNEAAYLMPLPDTKRMFLNMWAMFSKAARSQRPDATFYAEKCSVWVPPLLRAALPVQTLYSIRDPRDTFLSTNAWGKKNKAHGFGRTPTDTDADHALKIAASFIASVQDYLVNSSGGNCLAVRYEDLVSDPLAALDPLRRSLSLNINPNNIDGFYDKHRTTKDKDASVARWKKESLADHLQAIFDINFVRELNIMNYPVADSSKSMRDNSICIFQKKDDAAAVNKVSGGRVVDCNEKGLGFVIDGHELKVQISTDLKADPIDEIWICLGGDIADSYRMKWSFADNNSQENSSVQPRVPGDHYRVVRFPVSAEVQAHQLSEIELTLERSGSRSASQTTGWIKWIRCISVPGRRDSQGYLAPAADQIAFSDAEVLLQQSAHISKLTAEFNRLTALVGELQRHIDHVEKERDVFRARLDKIERFLPMNLLRRLKSLIIK
jgi:hypothetical protein